MKAHTLIAPTGELDIATVGEFRQALSSAVQDHADAVVVDLSQVGFVDSSGLGAIVQASEQLRRDDRELALVVPPGSAAAVLLNLAGLQARLPIVESRQTALDER